MNKRLIRLSFVPLELLVTRGISGLLLEQYSAMALNGNGLDFIRTIEDNQDVEQDDSDSEEEVLLFNILCKSKMNY